MAKSLKDIARELGLNASTVSRAINKKTSYLVKESTRERILELVKREGFKPNIKARHLKRQKLTNFGFLLPVGIDSIFYNEYYNSLIKGVAQGLMGTEYSLTILPIKDDFKAEDVFDVLFNNETAGLVVSPYCKYVNFPVDLLKNYDFPILGIDNEIAGGNTYSILLDHYGAGALGAEVLFDKGVKDILFISDINKSKHSEIRKQGFYDFFNDKPEFSISNIELPFGFSSGKAALDEVMKLNKVPVSIFILNDEIAAGFINHLAYIDREVSGNIRVIGFDGLSIRNYTRPTLASIGFPFVHVGELVADTLIDIVEGRYSERKKIVKAGFLEGDSFPVDTPMNA